ncbi:unnamed protein product, partial [Laminaria digitata]
YRTAYSAAFVAVGALGMAFGPFFSAMMNGVKFKIAGIMFNGLTNPGWIMFIFWIIMGLIVHFEFQVRDVTRKNIQEKITFQNIAKNNY